MSETESNNYTPECGAMVRYVGNSMDDVGGLHCGDTGIYRGIPGPKEEMRGGVTALQWAMKYGQMPHQLQKNGETFFFKRIDIEPCDPYDMCEPGGGWENCEWQPPKSETSDS